MSFLDIQMKFYCKYRAPQGCVQYFMEPTGTFQSYAYQNSQMLVNQQYATCFRKNLGNRYIFKLSIDIFHQKFQENVEKYNVSYLNISLLGMCTINFAQTLLANDNTGANQESSSFALSEPMNGMAVVIKIYVILLS